MKQLFVLATAVAAVVFLPSYARAATSCNATSCGAPPPVAICPGVSPSVPRVKCVYNSSLKRCAWKILPCPCNSTSCGPQLGMLNYMCPDKTTIAGPGPCSYYNITKKCGWVILTCPTCKKNSDCKGYRTYCSTDGYCRASATCSSNYDCVNSANKVSIAPLYQSKCAICTRCVNRVCRRVCTRCSSVCPSKTNFTNCNVCQRVQKCLKCHSTC